MPLTAVLLRALHQACSECTTDRSPSHCSLILPQFRSLRLPRWSRAGLRVPSLVGMPVEDALALMGQLGLTAGAAREDSTSKQPDGFVSGQRPAANTPVTPGSTIGLTISRPRAPRDSTSP